MLNTWRTRSKWWNFRRWLFCQRERFFTAAISLNTFVPLSWYVLDYMHNVATATGDEVACHCEEEPHAFYLKHLFPIWCEELRNSSFQYTFLLLSVLKLCAKWISFIRNHKIPRLSVRWDHLTQILSLICYTFTGESQSWSLQNCGIFYLGPNFNIVIVIKRNLVRTNSDVLFARIFRWFVQR
jgi:hypothetical protein